MLISVQKQIQVPLRALYRPALVAQLGTRRLKVAAVFSEDTVSCGRAFSCWTLIPDSHPTRLLRFSHTLTANTVTPKARRPVATQHREGSHTWSAKDLEQVCSDRTQGQSPTKHHHLQRAIKDCRGAGQSQELHSGFLQGQQGSDYLDLHPLLYPGY